MRIHRLFTNIIIMCILIMIVSCQGIQYYKTVQQDTPAQSPLSFEGTGDFTEETAFWNGQETFSRVTASIQSSASHFRLQSGAQRYPFLYALLFLTLLSLVSKCSQKGVCHYVCCHTCGLKHILTFIQDMDGRKKIL